MYKTVLKGKIFWQVKKIQTFKKKKKPKRGSPPGFNNGINAVAKIIFRLEQILESHATKENEKKCWAAQNFIANTQS